MFKEEIKENKSITVLGKTFASEEERRVYFREKLRKKLPELKKIEGFPIGEDEDIINLSDPPYYTACPNPWLNDFIAEWEDEKKHLEKEGKRIADFEVNEPYAADVSEGKNNPVYKAHTYVTKVPHYAIMRYLMHYTQPGDIVLDGFSGTGMTGVASSSCGVQVNVEKIFDSKYSSFQSRNSILFDISTIANYIAYQFNFPFINLIEFKLKIEQILEGLENKYAKYFETIHTNGKIGCIDYVIWSDVFICKNCNDDIVFWDHAVDHVSQKVHDEFKCPKCGTLNNKRSCERKFETYFDPLLNSSRQIAKRKQVLIKYSINGKSYLKKPDRKDKELMRNQSYLNEFSSPLKKMPLGHNTKQPLRSHGYEFVHDFFSIRNWNIISELNALLAFDEKLVLTALLNRSTNLNATVMSNYFKQMAGNTVGGWAGKPREGTLYMPSISTEVNVLKSIKTRLRSIIRLKNYINEFGRDCIISNSSITNTELPSNSIDYIFVDPPFGANRMYSELNFIMESWLKVNTNSEKEAIENKAQGKSFSTYSRLMKESFEELFRVLKKGKWMTVEFSNTNASVWNAIQFSIQSSGFIIANISALDKKQGSVKALTTPTAVKQDLIISCYKPTSAFDQKFKQHQHTAIAIWDFVQEHLNHLPIHLSTGNSTTAIIERSPKILFDRLIAFYVQKGLPVPIDAGKFQQGLRERFLERDGMFFTDVQVQEYDRKKQEFPEVIQLSLLVSSEQDGVLWLKNLLQDKPLTYSDIQPLWMQALAGVRKGDVIPELATILEENFLKDDSGKWYLPDPENEADLEKLRNKRLLKQFEQYKEEALKPRTKRIKEVRVEALRAGFKQCYQEKDFKTIVMVGDKIRNNLLMEDEVLLQFYDIASSRV